MLLNSLLNYLAVSRSTSWQSTEELVNYKLETLRGEQFEHIRLRHFCVGLDAICKFQCRIGRQFSRSSWLLRLWNRICIHIRENITAVSGWRERAVHTGSGGLSGGDDGQRWRPTTVQIRPRCGTIVRSGERKTGKAGRSIAVLGGVQRSVTAAADSYDWLVQSRLVRPASARCRHDRLIAICG